MIRRGMWISGILGFLLFLAMLIFFPFGTIGIIFGSGLYDGLIANRDQARKLYEKGYELGGDETSRLIAETQWKLKRAYAAPPANETV